MKHNKYWILYGSLVLLACLAIIQVRAEELTIGVSIQCDTSTALWTDGKLTWEERGCSISDINPKHTLEEHL